MSSRLPRSLRVAFGGFAALALCSCSGDVKSSTPDANVVAQVGGRSITVDQLAAVLNKRGQSATPEQKRLALQDLIHSELLLWAARTAGYHQKPELLARFDELVVAEYREQKLQPLLRSAEKISEAEVRSYYDNHALEYTDPEAVRANVIFLSCSTKATKEKRAEAAQKAESIRREAQEADESRFARLAQEYSADQASRYAAGDTGWLFQQAEHSRWPQEVATAAAALSSPGRVAPIVETEAGFYIVRLREKRPALRRPLAEVAPGIRYVLVKEKQREAERRFYEQLESGVQIQINGPVLDSISGPSNKAATKPPVLPGG